MKLSKFIMPIACLCLLTACDDKVSKEKFVQEIENIQEHKYKKAIVKYSDDSTNEKIDGKFTFTLVDGAYENSDGSYYSSVASYYLYLDINAIVDNDGFSYYVNSVTEDDPKAKVKNTVNYYLNPFKIVASFSSSATKDEGTEERKMEYTYKFDKYGNLTFMDHAVSIINSKKNDDAKYSITTKQHFKMEISYKD